MPNEFLDLPEDMASSKAWIYIFLAGIMEISLTKTVTQEEASLIRRQSKMMGLRNKRRKVKEKQWYGESSSEGIFIIFKCVNLMTNQSMEQMQSI